MSNEELVNVLVPRRHLSQVYGFIAQLEAAGTARGGTTASGEAAKAEVTETGNGANNALNLDEWTPSRLRKMVEQSPPAMADILEALADRPCEWLSMEDLAAAIKNKPDADWNTVAGTLGAFGRRVKNRYGIESWPFENRYDHEIRGRVCRMSEDMARLIKQFLAERSH
ncbi:MAG: hypothetical protein DYG94_06365 [Leptolyngbya sp. PLA3]|nr:MAG: hypothetical protein EDM82_05645 [Cyanobacteria bacterium CYA]MCE7968353.1 hypothetical protein [Leptolyngbya sp. PL-A3]